MGRFISADDISMVPHYALTTDFNLYAYAYGNPIKYTDAEGNFALVIGGITLGVCALVILSAVVAISFFMIFFPAEFGQVVNVCYSKIVDFFNACKSRSTSFWEKRKKSKQTHIHHIVAKTAKDAAPARAILEEKGFKVLTDSRNLVGLKARFHQKLHTNLYHQSVYGMLKPVENDKNKVRHALFVMKVLLSAINLVQ